MVPQCQATRAARDGRWAAPTAETPPPTPPAPTPRPESEPALLPDCRFEPPPPAPPPAEIRTQPHPEPPARLAVPGPGAARPAFRMPPAGPSAYSRSEPAQGREKLPLTPEEKARLEAMDPGVRDQILTWLMLGDPILMREVRAKLAPPRPRLEAPQSVPELLSHVQESPDYPAMAARLCRALDASRLGCAHVRAISLGSMPHFVGNPSVKHSR